jgi:hypothetical protein
MAPGAIVPTITDVVVPKKDTLGLPETARTRLEKAGIDLSNGYPFRPNRPLYLQDVYNIRNEARVHNDAGARADKSKTNLLSAASKVTDLTTYIGTKIEGIQLKDLTNEQRDELALLVAERSVVVIPDQDLTPQKQKELGEYFGEVEVHVRTGKLVLADPSLRKNLINADDKFNTASSSSGPGRSRCNRYLARPASNRACRQLSQPGWCVAVA